MMLSAQNGHELCARVLIGAGAHKDRKTNSGEMALDIARRRGHTALCELLA